jgi:hypothetical protein
VLDLLACPDDRLVGTLDQMLVRPVVEGDADDGAVEQPAALEPVQRAERHDPREVAGDPEDHENVGRQRPTVRLPVHPRSISPRVTSVQGEAFELVSKRASCGEARE